MELSIVTIIMLLSICTFSLILTYPEGVEMLRANGVEMGDEEDLRYVQYYHHCSCHLMFELAPPCPSTPNEKLLGRLVKEKVCGYRCNSISISVSKWVLCKCIPYHKRKIFLGENYTKANYFNHYFHRTCFAKTVKIATYVLYVVKF